MLMKEIKCQKQGKINGHLIMWLFNTNGIYDYAIPCDLVKNREEFL